MFGFFLRNVQATYGKVNVPSVTLIRFNWGFIISPTFWYRPVSKLKKVLRSHSRKRIRGLRAYYMIDRDLKKQKALKEEYSVKTRMETVVLSFAPQTLRSSVKEERKEHLVFFNKSTSSCILR